MLVAMRTWSSEQYDDEYAVAIFKMETAEARLVAQKQSLFEFMKKSNDDLEEMVFKTDQETTCEFYPDVVFQSLPKAARESVMDIGWFVFPDDYHPKFTPKDARAPDAVFLCFNAAGFYWKAIDTAEVNTEVLSYDLLRREL